MFVAPNASENQPESSLPDLSSGSTDGAHGSGSPKKEKKLNAIGLTIRFP
jgi:hypothetical protein